MVMLGFVVTFLAGGSVGMLSTSGRSGDEEHSRGPTAHLAKELELTAGQQEQMREIWSGLTRSNMREFWDRRAALRNRRTQAIEALLTDEQRTEYDRIQAEYGRDVEAIEQERQQLIQDAVDRTKAILTEEQAKKYEEMRAERNRRRGPRKRPYGPFGPGRRREPGTRPTHGAHAGPSPGPHPRAKP